jgi:NADH-quinone oxidoreductase subunit E
MTEAAINSSAVSLTETEKRAIDAEMQHYEQRQAVSVEALKIVQKERGWISDELLKAIADYTKIPAPDLEAVATFYNLIFRQPVGRHVVMVCDSVSCWICGYEDLKRTVEDKLGIEFGQTTADGRFTLLPSVCLGNCDKAPALMIDEDHYGNVSGDSLDEILEKYQ